MNYYVQHKAGRPIAINPTRVNRNDVVIDAKLAHDFYLGKEQLSQWAVVNNKLVENGLGIQPLKRGTKALRFGRVKPDIPSLVVVANLEPCYIEVFFPLQYMAKLQGMRVNLYLDEVPYLLNFSDFDNGRYRIYTQFTKQTKFRIDNKFRNVVLTREYKPMSYKSAAARMVDVFMDDYIIKLPGFLQNQRVFNIDAGDRNHIQSVENMGYILGHKDNTVFFINGCFLNVNQN